jgi:uncharacterized repeat protein (TIGR01451 family)
VDTHINNVLAAGNNSPAFSALPTVFLCAGQPATCNFGAIDPDGDELEYSLAQPLTNVTTPITYNPGFSIAQPMCSVVGSSASLDSLTGVFSILPCPSQQAALTVVVSEYRLINGVRTFIGSIRRDMQIIVLNCGTNSSPTATAPSNIQPATSFSVVNNVNQFNLCVGTSLSFQITATDADTATVLTALANNLPQGATLTQSGTNPVVATFNWTPTANDGGSHLFSLEVTDNFCPIPGRVRQLFAINVQAVSFNISQSIICNGTPTSITLNALPAYNAQGANYAWSASPLPANFNPSSSSGVYTATVTQPTTFTVVYSDNVCTASSSKSVQAYGGVTALPSMVMFNPATMPPIQASASYLNPPPIVPPSSGLGTGQTCNNPLANHTIGAGTQITTGGIGSPFQGFWHDGRFQMLLTGGELQAAGLQYGLINSLNFDIIQKGSTIPYTNFTIKMGATADNSLTAGTGYLLNTNVVYTNAAYTTTLGINTFNFQTPFFWNGLDNLIVEICFDNTAYTNYDNVNYTQTSANEVLYTRTDNAVGCTLALPIATNFRPNITFGSCSVTAPLSNVTYSWTSATGTVINPTTANPTLVPTGIDGTIDLFIVTATDGICTSSDTISVSNVNANVCGAFAVIQSSGSLTCSQLTAILDAQTYSGGTSSLTYLWNNGATNPILTVTAAGVYTVTVTTTGSLICTSSASVTVTSSVFALNAMITASHDTLTCQNPTTLLTAMPSQNNYTFQWSNNATTPQITAANSGIYTVTITDGTTSCSATATVNIASTQTLPTGFSNFVPTQLLTCNNPTLFFDACSTIPNNQYTYQWNDGSTACLLQVNQAGTYTVTVRDSTTGCTFNLVAYAVGNFSGPIISVATAPPPAPLGCGSATLTASVGNPQSSYTYLWNTGATTNTTIANQQGDYTVTITDTQTGCTASASLSFVQMFVLPNITAVSDCNAPTGQVLLQIVNGFAPYTVSFDGNVVGTTANVSYFLGNIGVGAHVVSVLSSNGCTASSPFTMNCPDAILNGLVFDDINSNGTFDTGETPIVNQLISAVQNGQTWYGVSDANGIYTINLATIGNYTLNVPYLQSSQTVTTGNMNVVAQLNTTTTTNIGIHTNPGAFNLGVSVYHGNLRPGNIVNYYLYYNNSGALAVNNAKIKLHIQGFVPSSFGCSLPYFVSNDTLIISLGAVSAGHHATITAQIGVPATTALGLSVNSTAVISPLSGDADILNNTYTRHALTTGSFDPNDKRVNIASYTYEQLPSGAFVTPSPELEYIIRFQNTGTDTAFNVRVSDTLSSFLNLSTFKLVGSSYPCTVQISNNRVATFSFNGINLVHAALNEPKSHGFVVYMLRPDDNLIQNGVPIRNAASIFFDYNVPIYTNQVYTTPSKYLIDVPSLDPRYNFTIVPNPAENNVTITPNLADAKAATLVIRNMLGQVMSVQAIQNQHAATLSVSEFAQGVYTTEIWVNEKLVATKKLVKM